MEIEKQNTVQLIKPTALWICLRQDWTTIRFINSIQLKYLHQVEVNGKVYVMC